jgi:hypothetical protein
MPENKSLNFRCGNRRLQRIAWNNLLAGERVFPYLK